MEQYKRQISVGIVIVTAIALGILVYVRFAGQSDLGVRGNLERRADDLRRSAETARPDTVGFETGAFAPIPAGTASVDDVASGIGSDIASEDGLLDEEVAVERDALDDEEETLNEYDDLYEEDTF